MTFLPQSNDATLLVVMEKHTLLQLTQSLLESLFAQRDCSESLRWVLSFWVHQPLRHVLIVTKQGPVRTNHVYLPWIADAMYWPLRDFEATMLTVILELTPHSVRAQPESTRVDLLLRLNQSTSTQQSAPTIITRECLTLNACYYM